MKLGNSGYGYSSIVVITILRPHCHSAVWCAAIVRLYEIQKGVRTRSRATTISKEANKYEENRPAKKTFVSHSKLHAIPKSSQFLLFNFTSRSPRSLLSRKIYNFFSKSNIYCFRYCCIIGEISLFVKSRNKKRRCGNKLAASVILLQRQIERRSRNSPLEP